MQEENKQKNAIPAKEEGNGLSDYNSLLGQAINEVQNFRARAGEYVPKMYKALRKEGVDPADAKDRIEKDLIGIWEKDTIRRHLPVEAKDPSLSAAAKQGNKQRKAGFNPGSKSKQLLAPILGGDTYVNDPSERQTTAKVWNSRSVIIIIDRNCAEELVKHWPEDASFAYLETDGSRVRRIDCWGEE